MSAQVYNQAIERLHRPVPTPLKCYKRSSPAKGPLNRTKRNLFGKVEPKAFDKYVKAELSRETELKTKRYNFDFKNGCPLDGPLKWERVGVQQPVAMVTLTPAAHVIPAPGRHNPLDDVLPAADELPAEQAERPPPSPPAQQEEEEELVQVYPIPPPRRISPRTHSPKLRQPKILEFMKERKRRPSSTLENVSSKKGRMVSEPASSSGLQQQEASTSK